MDAQRGQQKINHKNFLQHYLHNRMAASSTVILAGLLCAADVVAESRTWVGGSAYVPKAAITLPVPFNGTGGIESFIKAGELSDSAGNKITSLEQFNLLRDDKSQVMRIDQKSGRVILNWESFDIGKDFEVKFVQPSTTSLALNKINNSTSPSEILGKLTANGGVYLINHNGIIFGNGSQVNVGSLVASSLDVDDDLFSYKSLSKAMMDDDKAAFSLNDNKDATGTVVQVDTNGDLHMASGETGRATNAKALRGDIAVQKGASINTTTLNGAVLVAPNVVNEGDIKTPDGQTILAAAQDEAFVLFSSDPALRGLLIEVNAGGDVTNLGNIIAERGNVTLAGLAVNVGNDATIRATTSVDFNGTIRLLARDTLAANPAITAIDQVSALLTNYTGKPNEIAAKEGKNKYRIASHGGNVIIGNNAIIEVTPELDSKKTAVTAQAQGMSGVEISGNTILLKEGANITAKGGNIFLEATNNISSTIDQSGYLYNLSDKSRITLEKNSSIDVSGVQVDLPMSRNVIEVELRGTELADSPLQRSGFLYGKKVLVDIRKGTPLGDISGALAAIPKTVGERLTEGGSIQLRSAGDVVVQKDAKLNVSGGGIHYAAGYVETTNLLSEGKIVNIADADPARTYTGILGKETATNKRFNITKTFSNFFISSDRGEFVNAFDQGSSAGAFTLKTQAASFNGSVLAGTLSGVDQRDPTKTHHPDGGTFNLEVNLQNIGIADIGTVNCDDSAPCVLLKTDTTTKKTFATDTLNISQDLFNLSGFEHYNITARNGGVVLSDKANLQLADGASLKVTATDSIDINGTIKSTGGKVSFTTEQNKVIGNPAVGGNYDSNNLNRPITLGDSAVINTSGSWYNDNPLLSGNDKPLSTQTWIDAGAVTLKAAGDLLLNAGSEIVANGGGWVNRLGSFVAGKGGNINLSAQLIGFPSSVTAPQAGAQLSIEGAKLSSYAFAKGGELSITAPSIRITADDNATSSPETFLFKTNRFQAGGFSAYNLTAEGSNQWVSNFTIDPSTETEIKPIAFNYAKGDYNFDLKINASLNLIPTGSNLHAVLGVAVLPDYERNPVNLSFALSDQSDVRYHPAGGARDNTFIVPYGVKIETDPKAKINFTANTSIAFDGKILNPGGTVNFSLQGFQIGTPFDYANYDDVGIWLGSSSEIKLNSDFISAPLGADGLTKVGKVINAGSLSLSTARGFVITEKGSIIDISAQAYATERYVSDDKFGSRIETTMAPAQAGSLSIKAAEGILFDGELNAKGAGYGALGGTLNVELNRAAGQIPDGALAGNFGGFDFSTIRFVDRKIILMQDLVVDASIPKPVMENLGTTGAVSDDLNGVAKFSVKKLVESGLDSYIFNAGYTEQPAANIASQVDFKSTDSGAGKIVFAGDVSLVAGRSIELKSTTLGATDGRGVIVAPNIKMGVAKGLVQDTSLKVNTGAVSGGFGELFFAATDLKSISDVASYTNSSLAEQLLRQKTIDILPLLNSPTADGLLSIAGHVTTQGADSVTLASAGDIRATGLLVGDGKGDNARYLGSFSVNKNLTLQADQIFPTTLSEFIFSSGQYDFNNAGSLITEDGPNKTSLNSVNAVAFTLQYTDKNGVLRTETELATTYEAYDFIAGKLGVGDTVVHPDQSQLAVNKTIIAINTNFIDKTKKPVGRSLSGDMDGSITILSGGKSSPVQSAVGTLMFDAPNIAQNGTLKAPFGRIVFNTQNAQGSGATKGSVVMGEGSLTSVSAENNTIPFGELDASGVLTYDPNPSVDIKTGVRDLPSGVRLFTQSPEAKVVVNSANIDLHKSATVDLSGGGDLLAYRFVPGPGGSKDVLAAANSGKSFAVVPSIQGQYAAYDPAIINEPGNANVHTGRSVGERIYLSGAAGLPAGEYTILPARYALLPGAFLITPTGDGQVYSQGQQVRRVDGTPVVAGRFTVANTGEYDSQYSGFIVEPGTIAKTRSEYVVANASDLFSGVDTNGNYKGSPNDAAGLSLSASASLNLEANVITKAAENGRSAELEIAGNDLLITDKKVAGVAAVQVLVDQLTGFDSILIGGARTSNSDGSSSIKASAQHLEVAKDTVLRAPNILLVAKGTETQKGIVKLNSGAQVDASGDYQQQTTALTFLGDSLLSVSSGKPVVVTQNSVTQGDLLLGKDSIVHADNGSVLLLSNAQTQLDGSLQMQGGALNVGAGRVSLGQVNNSAPGLKFTSESLANLKVDSLQLTSATSLDFYGAVNLNFTDLTLQASSLQGFNGNGTAVLDLNAANIKASNSLTLLGNSTALPADSNTMSLGLGKGGLTIAADKLVLGKGNLAIAGFEQLSFSASTALVGQGSGNYHAYGSKSVTFTTPLLTGTGAANTQFLADGGVNIQASGSVSEATLKTYNGLGSRWAISGSAMDYTGNAILPSGELTLSALGTQGENLNLGSGANIDVSGRAVMFDDVRAAANGGSIKLNSASGNVVLSPNSRVNISGVADTDINHKDGSGAGKLSIQALAGNTALAGSIAAASGTNSKGGSLDLAVKAVTDFSNLVKQVAAGNFSEAFGLRVSTGDLTLKTGEQLNAHNLSLTADNGSITIGGSLNAAGDKGQITLNASKDLTLQSTAQLSAASTNDTKGGDVFLGTSGGFINVIEGAKINVSSGGSVTLRAPRTQNGNIISGNQIGDDVAINLQGAEKFNLQTVIPDSARNTVKVNVNAFKVYDILAATSEIFNTDADGNSTLSDPTIATVIYRDSIPFGALCDKATCSDFIRPDSDNSTLVMYPDVSFGEPLPVGAVCGDQAGCSYSYRSNNASATIANIETQAFMTNAQAIEERLFGTFTLKQDGETHALNLVDDYHLKPELELRSSGDLNVDQAIDFGEGLGVLNDVDGDGVFAYEDDQKGSVWRYNDEEIRSSVYYPSLFSSAEILRFSNGEAGVLTLRSQGDIAFNAPVSDGFAKAFTQNGLPRVELSDEVKGWSYNWVAGADLTSANTTATGKTGQLAIADNVVLRTNTGDINIVAGSNLLMGNNAALYTAGHATGRGVYDALAIADGFDTFDFSILANAAYGVAGGQINITVGNDLAAEGTPQTINDWLQRAGGTITGSAAGSFLNSYLPTTWAVVYEDFKQGIAALGGGDIHITAGGDIHNLAVSLPTTGKNNGFRKDETGKLIIDDEPTYASLEIQGGGDLSVVAGGDILSGQFYTAKGNSTLQAAGNITAASGKQGIALALADGHVAVTAGGSVDIARVFNPTVEAISATQTGTNILEFGEPELAEYQNNFYTYSADSSIFVTALSGDVEFSANTTATVSTAPFVNRGRVEGISFNVYPAQLSALALQGDIYVQGRADAAINLFPSKQGNLSLLAAKNISSDSGVVINVPDSNPDFLPGPLNPINSTEPSQGTTFLNLKDYFKVVALGAKAIEPFDKMHAAIPLYTNNVDPVRVVRPVRVVAQSGDVSNIRLVTPTHAWVSAGRDINNVTFEFQNVHENDVSIVKAGRDIIFETPRNPVTNLVDGNSATQGIDIAGYGSLDLIAGRNISLGASRGVQSIGAQRNPNLIKQGFGEESGADINLWAGIKTTPDYAGFTANYLGLFSAIEGATTTAQLVNSALNLDTAVRTNAEHFIKSVSGVTHRDYFSGVKSQSISDADMGAYVTAARTDFKNLSIVKQQQIAFRIANTRSDNYAGDLIELVTSPRFGGDLRDVDGTRLDTASLLNKPIAEQYQLALAAFKAAPVYAQRQLILQTYFNEIKQGGIQDVSGAIVDKDKDGFARSTAAINALFPTQDATATKPSENFKGDISLIFSTVQTQQGGNVNLIAPGGGIDVGAAAMGGGVKKEPSTLGLIALRNGSVNATVNGFTTTDDTDAAKKQGYSIRVNASRVFALDGGDILLWSTDGDIDAGRGAKSALSVPPPVILEDGSVNFQAAISGSGIRNSRFTQDRSPGAVYLFAPTGVVNAGDAGIGSQGDVLIAAQQVIGADNIDVGGVSIGIPVSTGISAGVAGAGAATASATDSVAKDSLGGDLSESVDQKGSAFVTIDILGFDF